MPTKADNNTPHIVIVGGGMVGISLALALAKSMAALECPPAISLIEKHPLPESTHTQQPSFDARSTALSAGSVQLLDTLGVWADINSDAEAIADIHISDRGHYGNTLIQAQDYKIPALGYVVENQHLGRCLLKQLQKTAINCIAPATVEHCQLTQQGAELSIRQEAQLESLTADLLLIADGTQSPLRSSLGIASSTKAYQQSAIITNVALDSAHQGIAYERFTEQGPLAVLPLPGHNKTHRASVVWTRHNREADTLMRLDDAEFMQQLQNCFGYRAGRLLQVGQRHCYPLQLVQAEEQVRSHIVVLGNAAHFLHPVAGQGFNLSLRDSEALVKVLHHALSHNEPIGHYKTLKRYQQRREKDQQTTITLTDTMVKLFSSQKISSSIFRQLGLMGLTVLPTIKTPLARQMMGLS